MADRSVTIQYRYAGYKETGSSLLSAINAALRQVDHGTTRDQSWKSRLLNRDDGRCIFANNIRRSPEHQIEYLFGDLIMFEENASFSIFRDIVGPSVAIEIENLDAGENFLKGKGFWFIVEDHVFLIGDPSVRLKEFESYFRWLASKSNAAYDGLTLSAKVDPEIWKKDPKGLSSFKAVLGGRNLTAAAINNEAPVEIVEAERTIKLIAENVQSKIVGILSIIFDSEAEARELVEKAGGGENLTLLTRLSLKTRSLEKRKELVAAVEHVARNLDDDEVMLNVRGGSSRGGASGGFLSVPRRIPLVGETSELDANEVVTAFISVYKFWVDGGMIDRPVITI